jgi:hypothetical protein
MIGAIVCLKYQIWSDMLMGPPSWTRKLFYSPDPKPIKRNKI